MNVDIRPGRSSAGTRNYPLNCWWVAATSEELVRKPIGRWLLDIPVVLYRSETGAPVALENRCLHRWAPLSEGFLEGDLLVCPYHGARFAPDGRCVGYPTQDTVPESARIRGFAVIERGPFVWIWLGSEDKRAAAEPPPDFPWTRDPSWTVLSGSYGMDANYFLIHENLLDLTHFNYLHRGTLKITNKVPPVYRVDGNRVLSHNELDVAGMAPEVVAAIVRANGTVKRQVDLGAFVAPSHHMASVTIYGGDSGEDVVGDNRINHFMTPESPTRTHYWWHFGIAGVLPPVAADQLKATLVSAFDEDGAMLVAIQNTINRDPRKRDYIELSFKGDMGGLQARRALERIMAEEERR